MACDVATASTPDQGEPSGQAGMCQYTRRGDRARLAMGIPACVPAAAEDGWERAFAVQGGATDHQSEPIRECCTRASSTRHAEGERNAEGHPGEPQPVAVCPLRARDARGVFGGVGHFQLLGNLRVATLGHDAAADNIRGDGEWTCRDDPRGASDTNAAKTRKLGGGRRVDIHLSHLSLSLNYGARRESRAEPSAAVGFVVRQHPEGYWRDANAA